MDTPSRFDTGLGPVQFDPCLLPVLGRYLGFLDRFLDSRQSDTVTAIPPGRDALADLYHAKWGAEEMYKISKQFLEIE